MIPQPRPRPPVFGAAVIVIALGVASKVVVPGLPGDLLGSACYTALLVLLASLVLRRTSGTRLALLGFVASCAVEFLQLTRIPEAIAGVVPLSSWVLGTTFAPTDFVGYAAGALGALVLDRLVLTSSGHPAGSRGTRSPRGARPPGRTRSPRGARPPGGGPDTLPD